MRLAALVAMITWYARAADLCPAPRVEGQASAHAKVGQKWCVRNEILPPAAGLAVSWPAAGIERTVIDDRIEVAVCCFRHESAQPEKLHLGDREIVVVTHREDPKTATKEDDDEFPDLIEDDAHGRAISIRGTLTDGIRVDLLLRCTASKFADQYAFQFTVIDKSPDKIEIDWDHLRILRTSGSPSIQPVAGGTGYVFLTAKRPREALATIELKTAGRLLGRFHFDGFTLVE